LAQSLRSIVYVLENFRRTFANIVAPPIDIVTILLFSALQSTSISLTDIENCVQIDPSLAMLSFLKMLQN